MGEIDAKLSQVSYVAKSPANTATTGNIKRRWMVGAFSNYRSGDIDLIHTLFPLGSEILIVASIESEAERARRQATVGTRPRLQHRVGEGS
jgi:hypothetical protein